MKTKPELGDIIGMDTKQAGSFLMLHDFVMRIIQEDGNSCIITADYRPDRVNVVLVDGKVTEYDLG